MRTPILSLRTASLPEMHVSLHLCADLRVDSGDADVPRSPLQIVNLTQALVSEFNRTLAYNPYPTPGKCL